MNVILKHALMRLGNEGVAGSSRAVSKRIRDVSCGEFTGGTDSQVLQRPRAGLLWNIQVLWASTDRFLRFQRAGYVFLLHEFF